MARLHPHAVLVLQLRGRHTGLLGVGVLDVADRTTQLLDARGDALIALAADTDRPGDLLVGAGGPHAAGRGGEVVREDPGRARAVGAMHDVDRARGQLETWVRGRDGRVVPRGDRAHEDACHGVGGQLQLTIGDALDVDDQHHAADDHRELGEAVALEVRLLEGRIRGAEVDGLGLDGRDAAARADRLVVELDAADAVVVSAPLGVERRREARAGAEDGISGLRWSAGAWDRAGARAAAAGGHQHHHGRDDGRQSHPPPGA